MAAPLDTLTRLHDLAGQHDRARKAGLACRCEILMTRIDELLDQLLDAATPSGP